MAEPQQPADAPSVQKRFAVEWSWLGLAFSFSDRKFIVSRKRASGSIHLTISYGNASGELDLHLKRELVAPGEESYIPLARVVPERLARAGERFNAVGDRIARSMLDHWRLCGPGVHRSQSHRASWERVARKLHGRRLHSSLLEALRRSSSTQQFASRGPALVIE